MMELLEGIRSRRSIRGFSDTPVSEETLQKIVKVAGNSPSFKNTQPWEVAIVCGKKKNDLSQIIYNLASKKAEIHPDIPWPERWPQEHEKRAKQHGAKRLAALGVERADDVEREKMALMNFEFYGAPCAIFLFMDRMLNEWSIFDMGLFAHGLILAAHAFGLGSCLQASVTDYAPEIKKFLEIPESKKLIIGISLGYPDTAAKLNKYRAVKDSPETYTKWYK